MNRVVTLPTTLPISVAEAKANGRIDSDFEDALVETDIRAALAHVERSCGQAFEPQTWEVTLDAFPTKEIELPLGPVANVTSVKYDDANGVEQTVGPADYFVDTASRDGWVIPIGAWPVAMNTANAVRVRYVAGLGTPPDMKVAILLLTELYYENRTAASEAGLTVTPFGVEAIMSLHRRMFV